MKAKYKTRSGSTFEAASELEIIEALRADSHSPAASMAQFMQDTALRCEQYSGILIRTNDPKLFVQDLLQHRLLQIK